MKREDWNKSGCNPFNNMDKSRIVSESCEKEYVLSIPEIPYIRNVKNPLGKHPFITVDVLRTPIKQLSFSIREFRKEEYSYVDTSRFNCVNYQNYVPSGIFRNNRYYVVSCIAVNDSGVSPLSNKYPVDLLIHGHNPESQKIICGGQIICGIPIECGL